MHGRVLKHTAPYIQRVDQSGLQTRRAWVQIPPGPPKPRSVTPYHAYLHVHPCIPNMPIKSAFQGFVEVPRSAPWSPLTECYGGACTRHSVLATGVSTGFFTGFSTFLFLGRSTCFSVLAIERCIAVKPHVKSWYQSSVVFRGASHGTPTVGVHGGFLVKLWRGSRGLSRVWYHRGEACRT